MHLNTKNSLIKSWVQMRKHNYLSSRRLQVAIDIRWNTTYLMLDKVIRYKQLFTACINTQLKMECLTDEDWTIAEIMNSFLKT